MRSPPNTRGVANARVTLSSDLRIQDKAKQQPRVQNADLAWEDLYAASQLARWSGLCYLPEDKLQHGLDLEGLSLVAQGRDKYTSWIVVEGTLDARPFVDLALRQRSTWGSLSSSASSVDSAASSSSSSSLGSADDVEVGPLPPLRPAGFWSESSDSTSAPASEIAASTSPRQGVPAPATPEAALAAAAAAVAAQAQGATPGQGLGRVHRFVLLRGVHWSAPDLSMLEMTRVLSSFWPVPFARRMTEDAGRGNLMSHSGVADVALELFADLAPHLRSLPAGQPLVFAGHSLGGALSRLLWVLSILHGHRSPDLVSCHSFGSPPVLSPAEGLGGDRVLSTLGAEPGSSRNWVLEHDPVPRAMSFPGPYLGSLLRSSAFQGLLQAQSWLAGSKDAEGKAAQSPVPHQQLFSHVGEVFLIKGGCEVVKVAPDQEAEELHIPMTDALQRPHKTVMHWLDHHHGSYAHDLEVAAMATLRQKLRSMSRETQVGSRA